MRRVLAIVLLALTPAGAFGQSAGATLTGTVRDSSGGVLPGATITVRNMGTNETRTATSNTEGLYRVTNLPRGNYEVRAELPSFKTVSQMDVLLTVGSAVRLDFEMEVGEITEMVSVTSTATLVNTEEGRLSTLVDERRVSELPLNGRNVLQLMELQPGAAANPGSVVLGGSAGGNTPFIAGQRNRANNFLLDGTDNNDQYTAGRVAANPAVDMVQEFRISSNNFSAEFGRNSAAIVSVVTKSGTNQMHGSAYEFLRNDALDARSVFATQKNPLQFNQFGGTVGGPITRDRRFFFASYGGLRIKRGQTLLRTVETPEYRALVAQLFPNSIANYLFTNFPSPTPTSNIRDTGRPVAGLQTQSVFNNPNVVNDPNYVATSATLYRNDLQTTPDGIPDIGTAAIDVVENTEGNQFSLRIDEELSPTMRVFGRYLNDRNFETQNQSIVRPGFDQPIKLNAHNLTIAHTWILSNRVVNEARFGMSKNTRDLQTQNEGVPQISFDDGVIGFGNFATNPAVFPLTTYHWTNAVSMTLGNHGVKWGGELRYVQDDTDFDVRRPGIAFFNIHDFAMDEASRVTIVGINPGTGLIEPNVRNFRFTELGFFIQDDWKMRRNLTLNLGLRWDWYGRPTEKNGLLNNMILGPGTDIFEQTATATVGRVNQVVPDDYNNFAPRLGFAWDPRDDGKIAVRGGFGVAYDRLFNNSITNIRFNPPDYAFAVANPVQVLSQAGVPIAYGPINPDGTRRNEPITLTGANRNIGVAPNAGVVGNIIGWNPAFGTSQQSLRVPDPNMRDAFTYNWFAGTQVELPWNLVFEANYVGNRGRNFGRLVDYNTQRGDLFDGRLDRLNPNFGGINFRAMLTRTEYHAGQFQLSRRFSRGLSAQGAYTIGRARDNGSDVQVGGLPVDARALDLEWGYSDFDVRHRVVANWLWELPFLRDAQGLTGTLFGGWQINGITQFQTGFPFSVFTSSPFPTGDYNGDGVNNDRPNMPGFGLRPPDTSRRAYMSGLFVASDFPRPDVLGDLPRNAYRGPSYSSTDLSLFKDFRFRRWQDAKLQFRVEAFNAFNQVNLRLPVGNLALPTFGRSVQSFQGREIQLALRFVF